MATQAKKEQLSAAMKKAVDSVKEKLNKESGAGSPSVSLIGSKEYEDKYVLVFGDGHKYEVQK